MRAGSSCALAASSRLLAYTTVVTMLTIMTSKGLVRKVRLENGPGYEAAGRTLALLIELSGVRIPIHIAGPRQRIGLPILLLVLRLRVLIGVCRLVLGRPTIGLPARHAVRNGSHSLNARES